MTSALPKLAPSQQFTPALETDPSGEALRESRRSGLDRLLTPMRREERVDEIRIAEYTPFPRKTADQHPRLGFTRDVSPLGMCIGVDQPEAIGSLLRVDVHRLDGGSMGASVARVVWCAAARDGRHWLGLDLLCRTNGGQLETERLAAAARTKLAITRAAS